MGRIKFLFIIVLFLQNQSLWASSFSELASGFYPFSGLSAPDERLDSQGHADVGLYVDKGAWMTGKEHLKMFLNEHGYTYRSLMTSDITSGILRTSGIKLLIMPGGESWTFLSQLGATGAAEILRFTDQGGSYMGFCAGAFYATSNREGGVTTGPYGIGLLRGTAYDGTSLQVDPFIEGMMNFDFFIRGFPSTYRIVLLGGPSFRYSNEEAESKHIQVLSRFQKIHEPAMIAFNYGSGRVFLSGPHPEVEVSRTSWGPEFADPISKWPMLDVVTHYMLRETTLDVIQ
jgi:glutamine amidotransferase-like uncharacterized protein